MSDLFLCFSEKNSDSKMRLGSQRWKRRPHLNKGSGSIQRPLTILRLSFLVLTAAATDRALQKKSCPRREGLWNHCGQIFARGDAGSALDCQKDCERNEYC